MMARRLLLLVALVLVLTVAGAQPGTAAPAQQADIEEAVRAVVRIVPQGCPPDTCGPGSGVIIHPSGVILTAWHVVVQDPYKPLTPVYVEDFLIEETVDITQPSISRFRARLIAASPQSDLALLRIYWDIPSSSNVDLESPLSLPTLPIAQTIPKTARLRIMGYSPWGGQSINYPVADQSGFDEGGTLLKVQTTLSSGYSGGPALLERNGQFEIVGLVIRRRGPLGEVGLIRSIDQLSQLEWWPDARRVWGEDVTLTTQHTAAEPVLRIEVEVHALDFADREGRLLAYAFDMDTGQPWLQDDPSLSRTINGQVVLRSDFRRQRVVDSWRETIVVPLPKLNGPPENLQFRVLLWDAESSQDGQRVLWQSPQRHRPPPLVDEPPPTVTPMASTFIITTPVQMEFVQVPAGEFLMGSDQSKVPEAEGDELPQHAVNLSEFYIGRHEVTNAQYAVFVEATGHGVPIHWQNGTVPSSLEDHPVIDVSWEDAVAFTDWLSAESGMSFRLPTEAQWEKACRGADGQEYPWGDEFDCTKGNFDDETEIDLYTVPGGQGCDGHDRTAPVGVFDSITGPYGALDMAGNVWEWVVDWYDSHYYEHSPYADPQGAESGYARVLRGGSWDDPGSYGRCADRRAAMPNSFYYETGFRVSIEALQENTDMVP